MIPTATTIYYYYMFDDQYNKVNRKLSFQLQNV